MLRLVLFADTHGQHGRLESSLAVPDGDVLIFAGDACSAGTAGEWKSFCRWFGELPHEHKIIVPGNHDWVMQGARPEWGVSARYGPTTISVARRRAEDAGAVVLMDDKAYLAGLAFWGSPWMQFFNHWAFNLPRGGRYLAEVWSRIPLGTDVLVTHCPAFGRLDRTDTGDHVGCEILAERLDALDAEGLGPRLHVHGDIHEAAGMAAPPVGAPGRMTVNAAVLDGAYRLARSPVVVDL